MRFPAPFELPSGFLARFPFFSARLDIPSCHTLSSMTMGGGKIDALMLIQSAQKKRNFLSTKSGGYSYFSKIIDRMDRSSLRSINKKLEPFRMEILEYESQKMARIIKKDAVILQLFSISQASQILLGCVYSENGSVMFLNEEDIYEKLRKREPFCSLIEKISNQKPLSQLKPIVNPTNLDSFSYIHIGIESEKTEKRKGPSSPLQLNSKRALAMFDETAEKDGNCFIEDFKAAHKEVGFSDSARIVQSFLGTGALQEC